MRENRGHPPRTVPVAVLDALLNAGAVIRAVPGRVARSVRRGDRGLVTGLGVAVLAAVLGAGLLGTALIRSPERSTPVTGAPPPSPDASAGAEGGPEQPAVGATPPATSPEASPPTGDPGGTAQEASRRASRSPAPPIPLVASYRTEDVGLLNYTVAVTISNPGRTQATGWALTITLPRPTQSVAQVTGAQATRNGSTWTFAPDQSTRRVPAGGSVQVTFRVDGAVLNSAPTGCTIDHRPCQPPSASRSATR